MTIQHVYGIWILRGCWYVRKSSLDAMLMLEHWVLANGFLDIVKQRNAFARAQGFDNYFDFKVQKNERMSTRQLFAILDDFEERTAQANTRALNDLVHTHGADATQPWNLRFYVSGDTTRQLDPYLSFGKGLERWITSFRHLGIAYRGATLQLDLLERKGKYQNGFCHGPIPPFLMRSSAGCRAKSTSPPMPSRTRWVAVHAPSTPCSTKVAMQRILPT